MCRGGFDSSRVRHNFGDIFMDEFYMRLALEEAYKALSTYEVPIGAVIVHGGDKVIGKGYNRRETAKKIQ